MLQACEHAFEPGAYLLVRLHLKSTPPSGSDLLSVLPGLSKAPRYFTYAIQCPPETEPDYSGMSTSEIKLVRRYLNRGAEVPHYGRTVLRPEGRSNADVFTEQRDIEDERRPPDTPVQS